MHWIWWIIVVVLGVAAVRNLWATYEALTYTPRKTGRAAFEFAWFLLDILLILFILGVIP
ncbi:MAG: hypothetical protein AAFX79_04845 [Planctomycetota bacterium]